MKIYTKTGDKGQTSLVGGTRVKKNDVRLNAYGTIDELNSFTGLLISFLDDKETARFLENIQNDLFDIGGILATDFDKYKSASTFPEEKISIIENEIDRLSENLPVLKSFVLPGGTQAASLCHVCRTVTRRAEREVYTMKDCFSVEDSILLYINRLSDYFFILARLLNNKANREKLYIRREK